MAGGFVKGTSDTLQVLDVVGMPIRSGVGQSYVFTGNNNLPLGHHTFGIECRGVPSTGVDRISVWN